LSAVFNSVVQMFALASGSSGNAMLVMCEGTSLLIDAGLGARTLAAALTKRGVPATGLNAILLTHEHVDHAQSAGAMSRRSGAPIIANRATLQAYAERDPLAFTTQELATGDEIAVGGFRIRSFAVPHDAAAPVGFVLEACGVKIAYFTDAGSVTTEMREALRGCNLAIVEANHDIDWLWRGPYTPEMKARVASPTGHLSNDDCADLLAERLDADGPLTIWLAHLSRVNNSPALAKRCVTARIQRQTTVPFLLETALRDHPSVSWRSGAEAVQLALL
jgi:phosphoribosyl 1,2-cyclic phosphodiesterase